MAQHDENRRIDGAVELLKTNGFDGLAEAVTLLLNSAMLAERSEYLGAALIVKDNYKPAYQFVSSHDGNHTFKITAAKDHTFEYLLSSAWSEGAVYNNEKDF